jgi:Tfp pilus assembly protein PilO
MKASFQKIVVGAKGKPRLVVLIIALLVCLAIVYFRGQELRLQQAELSDMRGNLAKLQKNVANSVQIERQLAEIRLINSRIEETALRPAELARNLQYFYALEATYRVKLVDLRQLPLATPPRGTPAPAYVPIRFEVNVAGEYEQLLQVMQEVGRTFTGGNILSATISPGSALPGQSPEKSRLLSMVVQAVAINK